MITLPQLNNATIEAYKALLEREPECRLIEECAGIEIGDGEFSLIPEVGIEEESTIVETIRRERVGYVIYRAIMEPYDSEIGYADVDVLPLDADGDASDYYQWYATLPAAYIALKGFQARADAARRSEFLASPGPINDVTDREAT